MKRAYQHTSIACTVLLASVALSGCLKVGPEYVDPSANVATGWNTETNELMNYTMPNDTVWWKNAFNDPELNRLVELALDDNLTLRSASLRVLQSQQQLAIAIGSQYPQQQQATGAVTRSKANDNIANNYSLGMNLSWEADIWGRFSSQVESASAAMDASVADYDGALVSIVSQVAQNYVLIRTFRNRVKVAQDNIELQQSNLDITQAKFNAGEVSELDVNQAQSLLNNTKATISSYEVSLQQLKNAQAVLLGQPPQAFSSYVTESSEIPSVQAEVALGMPQDLIRQRPDIRAAERRLAAQSAEIDYAITELYPHLSIGGSVGTSAQNEGNLFESDSELWDITGMFQWNIFNYGRLQSNIRLQDATFQQLLTDYRSTVINAQADVENTIVAYLKSHEQLESYQLAADASKRAVNISQTQYTNGLIPFNTVINTLTSDAQQQDLLATAKGTVASNLIQVYRALGGAWEIRNGQDPVDLLPASTEQEMLERTKYWEDVLD
ncbi:MULTISPECIES: efflux transporter outer membrane subunit [unclassified Lentimonas]|uniref:efflux transporter outer membrane subunit n=1 Tax=unclassified Lentimonas TaxID=2630993 RepID=UPI001322F93B|nr:MULTISPECIES: efflux transporter outer membrane subunit [unclassified Lentimonas]CAA6676940.1 Unannotated [Lentimonas sp. CC4]CAA6686746.1 Unannotated [Lentimonas sp. CC6]CAA7075676.1 RND efflux system, outer membrane lipoprotein CmeC [Lentimonas sp. CC4]CAA7168165.1 Unannotated [Lentimonas sp. CC21]CAA7181684.1 Unannotated [Lentimonas sp. CC8]